MGLVTSAAAAAATTFSTADRLRVMVSFLRQDALARPVRVGIVGGGPGGLFTAWHLERLAANPIEITIFEGSDRLGGKVLTPRFSAAPVNYEAGAAELYDYSPVADDPLRALVRSLGLPTVPLTGAAVDAREGSIANLDDVEAVLGRGAARDLLAFDAWARGAMTRREFYESGSDHASTTVEGGFDATLTAACPTAVRGYVEAMIHSDLATDPAATTAGYGLQNYLMNDPAYMRLYRIAGGNEQLISEITARLAATVRLAAEVTSVSGGSRQPLTLAWRHGDAVLEEPFDVVVVALPVAPLKRLEFSDASLKAAIDRHLAHHDHPAHYLRVTLLLDRPVTGVPGGDDFLMLDAFGGTCLYVESNGDPIRRHGVLGLLIGGRQAEQMATWDDDALVAAACAALPASIRHGGGDVLEARVHRWMGAVSAAPGGWIPLPVDRRHRPSAAHPNLFLVGDYLFDSTLNGVLDSAEHVAGWIAADVAALDGGRPEPSGLPA